MLNQYHLEWEEHTASTLISCCAIDGRGLASFILIRRQLVARGKGGTHTLCPNSSSHQEQQQQQPAESSRLEDATYFVLLVFSLLDVWPNKYHSRYAVFFGPMFLSCAEKKEPQRAPRIRTTPATSLLTVQRQSGGGHQQKKGSSAPK